MRTTPESILLVIAGQNVDVLLQHQDAPFERHNLIKGNSESGTYISGLMLGDFNGDVHMDVLVTLMPVSADKNQPIHVEVFLGNITALTVGECDDQSQMGADGVFRVMCIAFFCCNFTFLWQNYQNSLA